LSGGGILVGLSRGIRPRSTRAARRQRRARLPARAILGRSALLRGRLVHQIGGFDAQRLGQARDCRCASSRRRRQFRWRGLVGGSASGNRGRGGRGL